MGGSVRLRVLSGGGSRLDSPRQLRLLARLSIGATLLLRRPGTSVLQLLSCAEGRAYPLVPALEEGASKGAAEQVEHQQGGRRLSVNLDLLGGEGEDRKDVAVPPVCPPEARRRR